MVLGVFLQFLSCGLVEGFGEFWSECWVPRLFLLPPVRLVPALLVVGDFSSHRSFVGVLCGLSFPPHKGPLFLVVVLGFPVQPLVSGFSAVFFSSTGRVAVLVVFQWLLSFELFLLGL